jgi:ketopantoate hydroxymethyltransferase
MHCFTGSGCFAIVGKFLQILAAEVDQLNIPTISIGAGNACDGQML